MRKPWQRNADKTPPEWNEHKAPAEQNAQEPSFSDGVAACVISLMHGCVFEKVGLMSTSSWVMLESFRARIPGAAQDGRFWASGISLVSYMRSPKVPAVHMNTRMVATSGGVWFGGGTDLTPMLRCDEDAERFHAALKATCDRLTLTTIPSSKRGATTTLPATAMEPRGVGGIFFDNLRGQNPGRQSGPLPKRWASALPIFIPSWCAPICMTAGMMMSERYVKRGRYVEFNLLYDRGTTFGLKTGGNVEAILMSLPPEAHWP